MLRLEEWTNEEASITSVAQDAINNGGQCPRERFLMVHMHSDGAFEERTRKDYYHN